MKRKPIALFIVLSILATLVVQMGIPVSGVVGDGKAVVFAQKFDHLETADLPNYVYALGSPTNNTIVPGGSTWDGSMLSLEMTDASCMAGIKCLSLTEADRAAMVGSDAIVFYLKVNPDLAPGTKTAIYPWFTEYNPEAPQNQGPVYINNWTLQPITYVSVDGTVSVVSDSYSVSADPGFEGWVIVPFEYYQNHPAYPDADGQLDPDKLFSFIFYGNDAAGATYGVDEIGMVQSIPEAITYLLQRAADPSTVVFGQQFDHLATADLPNYVYQLGTNMNSTILDGGVPFDGRQLSLEFTGADAMVGIKCLSMTEEKRAASVNAQGLVFYMEVNPDLAPGTKTAIYPWFTEYNPEAPQNQGPVYINNWTLQPITYVSVDGTVSVVSDSYSVSADPGFKGWVIVPWAYYQNHPAYPDADGELDPEKLFSFIFYGFDVTGSVYKVDDIGLVNDIGKAIPYLKAFAANPTSVVLAQKFDHLATADLPNYVYALGSPTNNTILDGGLAVSGRMLDIELTDASCMAGIKCLSLTDEDRAQAEDAVGLAFYLKVNPDLAPGTKTAIYPWFTEYNPEAPQNQGPVYINNWTLQPITYVSVDGTVSVVSDAYSVSADPGFEGWIIVPWAYYQNHPAYPDTDGELDPEKFFSFIFYGNDVAGSHYGIDNIALVRDIDAAIAYFQLLSAYSDPGALPALPNPPVVPEGTPTPSPEPTPTPVLLPDDPPAGIHFDMGQGFGGFPVDSTQSSMRSYIMGFNDGGTMNYRIADGTLGNGNALEMKAKIGGVLFVDLFLDFPDRSILSDSEAVVMKLRPGTYDTFPQMMVMLMESEIEFDRASVGEVYMYYYVYSEELGNATTILRIDDATGIIDAKELSQPYLVENGFDGWVVIPKSYFRQHPGYIYEEGNGELDWELVTRLQFEFNNAIKDQPVYVDSIGFTDDIDAFLASIEAQWPATDIEHVQQAPDFSDILAADFQGILDSGRKLVIQLKDMFGYLFATWTFDGADIVDPQDFNPAITAGSEFEAAIRAMTQNFEGLFFTFAADGFPGPATLSLYVGDEFNDGTPVWVYRYDQASGQLNLVAPMPNGVVPLEAVATGTVGNGGFIEFMASEGGTYVVVSEELVLAEATPTPDEATPTPDEATPTTDTNPTTGDTSSAPLLLSALAPLAALLLRRKNRGQIRS